MLEVGQHHDARPQLRHDRDPGAEAGVQTAVAQQAVSLPGAHAPAEADAFLPRRLVHADDGCRHGVDDLRCEGAGCEVGVDPAAHLDQVRVQGRARGVAARVGVRLARHGQRRAHVRQGCRTGRHLRAPERAPLHAQRPQQLLAHGVLEGGAADPREQQAEELEAGVGVGERRARLGLQPPVRETAYEVGERVVVQLRVVPPVVRDVGQSAGVAQQRPCRHLGGPPVGEGELGHPPGDRGVQVDARPQDGSRHERLGDRRQVEHGLRRDRVAAPHVSYAEAACGHLAVVDDGDSEPGVLVARQERGDGRPQPVLDPCPQCARRHRSTIGAWRPSG